MLIMMLNFSPDMLGSTTCAGSLDLMTLQIVLHEIMLQYYTITTKNKHKDKIKAKKSNHTTLSKDINFHSFSPPIA
jgi:hypothetical protein